MNLPNKILQKQHPSIDIYLLKIIAAFAYFLLLPSVSFANLNKKEKPDTLKFTAPEVIIIGNKISTQHSIKNASSTIFTKQEINRIPALQISDIIEYSPGIYIKNYGGAGGMKTANIRGTNASQNLILLDGIAINSKQNSTFDLSLLPISFIEEIEITRGGVSDIFGANALGGAVNLITPKNTNTKYKINYNLASYNEHKLSLSFPTIKANKFLFNIATSTLLSKGNYKFKFNEYGIDKILSRENAQFYNYGLFFNSDYLINEVNYLNFKTINTYTDRGVPGAVVQNRVESKYATIKDFTSFNNFLYNIQLNNHNLLIFNIIGKYNLQKYNDAQENAIETLKKAQFINSEFGTNINHLLKYKDLVIKSNLEYSYSVLNGDMLDRKLDREVSRKNLAASINLDKNYILDESQNISIFPSARVDIYDKFQPSYSYAFGALYQYIYKNEIISELKARISNNFRIPSFNELYYFNYGTSDLLPEKSISYDLSTSFILLGNNNKKTLNSNASQLLKFELSTFLINTKDQIISVPKNTISWSAMNLGKVITRGIELLISANFIDNKLNTRISYTLQEAIDKSSESLNFNKQIIYTPQEILNTTVAYNLGDINFRFNSAYTSHRFSLPDNSYESMLKSYLVLNSSIAYNFNFFSSDINLQFELNNILNTNYNIIINYPMPGRTFRLGLKMEI